MLTPRIPRDKLVLLIDQVWELTRQTTVKPDVVLWGCSGYYFETLGNPAANDRGINDDAIGVLSSNVDYRTQANTDPSVFRKGVATLQPNQVIWYRPGHHGFASVFGHPAFRQDSPVVVRRDGTESFLKGNYHDDYGVCLGNGLWTDKDFYDRFWTNLHRQSGSGTSSLGCLTVPKEPWKVFHPLVLSELKRAGMSRVPLVLLQGPIN
jgi:lysozyme